MTFGLYQNEYKALGADLEKADGATPDDRPSTFTETHQAAFNLVVSEEQTVSMARNWRPELERRFSQAVKAVGASEDPGDLAGAYLYLLEDPDAMERAKARYAAGDRYRRTESSIEKASAGLAGMGASAATVGDEAFFNAYALIQDARAVDPTIETDEAILANVKRKTAMMREQSMDVMGRATGLAMLGTLTGSMLGAVTDPPVLATLPLGGGAVKAADTVGGTLLSIAKVSGAEAAIASGIEAAVVQPKVYRFKKQIDSPWGIKEATANVLAAGLGAGVLRGTGEVTVRGLRSLIRARREKFGKDDPVAADAERYVNEAERSPLRPGKESEAAHESAIDKAERDMAEGRSADVEQIVADHLPEDVVSRETPGIVAVDPRVVEFDAKRFQFKAGGDDKGVTDRLLGVTEWDPIRAGTALFYEDKAGNLFIVDGHQRLGLAKRLMDQPGNEGIRINGFILREADGVTPEMARTTAALKNIAEGSGRAVDAAKVLRDTGHEADLPNLPPNSALVKQAQGLSRLSDDAFMQVINDVIPERYGAIVGEVFDSAPEQAAAIKVLAGAQPANSAQARAIVEQVRAAGFEKTVTADLFGEQEIAESLFKEKAQIVDAAARRLRKEKGLFKTLIKNESRIENTGANALDHIANRENMTDAEKALAAINRLAYSGGEITAELDRAAKALKSGGGLNRVVDQFLAGVRRAAPLDSGSRIDVGAAGRAGEGLKIRRQGPSRGDGVARDPAVGRPVRKEDLSAADWVATEEAFKRSQWDQTLDELYSAGKRDQAALESAGAEIQAAVDGAEFMSHGLKARAKTEEKMDRKGYKNNGQLTDVIRGGFVVQSLDDADRVADLLYQRFEVLDEGWAVTGAGYFDRKLLVRFPDGKIGEIQLWEPNMLRAKEELGGHDIYYERRLLEREGGVPEENRAEYDRLTKKMRALYGEALRRADQSWEKVARPSGVDTASSPGVAPRKSAKAASQASRSMENPESPTSDGDTQVQGPPTERMAAAASPSSSKTAGRPSQSTKSETLDVSISTSKESIAGPDLFGRIREQFKDDPDLLRAVDPFYGDRELERAAQQQIDDAMTILDDGDLDVPDGVRITPEGDEEVILRSGREMMRELDDEERALKELITCMKGSKQ